MKYKIKYYYTNYPYSKRATDASHLASFVATFAWITLIPSVFVLVFGVYEFLKGYGWDSDYTTALLFVVCCITYLVLLRTKIRQYIEKMAEEDRVEFIKNRINENLKNKILPR